MTYRLVLHPISASLTRASYAAAKNCDLLIFNLVQDLVDAGIVSVSQTGQTITGGEILFKRAMGLAEGGN